MNQAFYTFNESASRLVLDNMSRSQILAAAVALAVANHATLPSGEVCGVDDHFNMQVMPMARTIISDFNENMIFDPRLCMELFRGFWNIRYRAAFPLSAPLYSTNSCFFDNLFGVKSFISEALLESLEKYKINILLLSNAACDVICKRKEQNIY
jgi:hypothetical protein